MKSIKCFKHWKSHQFESFLNDYGYGIADVKGFSVSSIKRYGGNVLKTYKVYVYDGESVYFSVVTFESFNEYRQSALGFNGNKMSYWYERAIIAKYKVKDVYGTRYIITK